MLVDRVGLTLVFYRVWLFNKNFCTINPRFQDKILRKNGAKILHSDWLIAKFGQLQSVVSRVSCVLY